MGTAARLRASGGPIRWVLRPLLALNRMLGRRGRLTTLRERASGAGYLLLRRQYRVIVLLAVATAGGLLVSVVLKDLFSRARPEFASGTSHVMTASFPSGHSMLSAIVYLTLGVLLARTSTHYRFKLYFLTIAVLVTVLVGLSRIYLGVHYPTDVLAGWSFGLIWALMCWLIAHFLQKRGTIEPPQEPD